MIIQDKSIIREYVQGKKIAIVGSAPTVLENEEGFIDSHEIVVRVNNYKLYPQTGKRTDIYYSFFGKSIKKQKEDLIADGTKFCMCKCPNARFMDSDWHIRRGKINGIDFRYIYEARKDWWFCPTYVPDLESFLKTFLMLHSRVPTTGFSAIIDLLDLKPKSIYLTGFDFFTSNIHNVNERWRKINHDDPIGHSPERERYWLRVNHEKENITMDKRLQHLVLR